MISDPNIARAVSALMLDLFQRVHESVESVRKACPPDELSAYQKATARVVGPIVMDVLQPLYERHPELKPPNWDN